MLTGFSGFEQVELMGGHMTVSSEENIGSTFTFVLPYRVSPISDDHSDDQSDDPDELPDANNLDMGVDDITAGYFKFEPRSFGSLVAASGTGRNPTLLQNNYGYTMLPDVNVTSAHAVIFPPPIPATCKEMGSPLNASSDADLDRASSDSSSKHSGNTDPECTCRARQFANEGNSQAQEQEIDVRANEVGQMANINDEPQQTHQIQASDRSLQSTASSRPAASKPEERPKILLVEDNRINVMVTRTMMRQLGHNIDVVNNGVEAVRAVQGRSYDLILMVIFL